ncbi:MAG TPA: hypothetical protein VL860_11100, partial [Planctomycetota bacterium]|nr:hypothetical protein [Planctomycetota bacterium]
MASIHFVCPVCAQNLKVSATLAGRKGRCPFCSAKVRIPVDDNGSAEVLDPGKKQDASDIASAPELSDAEAQAAIGPSVMMHPDSAPSGMAADPAQLGQPPGTGAPVAGGNDLQSQLDRELAGAGAPVPEHAHDSEAATVRWTAGAGPVIQAETTQPGSVPPMKIIRLQPNATDVSAAAELPQILPKAPREVPTPPPAEATASAPPSAPMMPKVETIKYGPDSNPARQSGEQRIGAVPTSSSADRFVETRHGATPARTEPPPAAAPTVSPDLPG